MACVSDASHRKAVYVAHGRIEIHSVVGLGQLLADTKDVRGSAIPARHCLHEPSAPRTGRGERIAATRVETWWLHDPYGERDWATASQWIPRRRADGADNAAPWEDDATGKIAERREILEVVDADRVPSAAIRVPGMDAVGDLHHHARCGVGGEVLADHAALIVPESIRMGAARAEQSQPRGVHRGTGEDDETRGLLLDSEVAVHIQHRLRPSGRVELDLECVALGAHLAAPCCDGRSEEHTSELQSQSNLVCRLLLEKKKKKKKKN